MQLVIMLLMRTASSAIIPAALNTSSLQVAALPLQTQASRVGDWRLSCREGWGRTQVERADGGHMGVGRAERSHRGGEGLC